MKFSDVKYKCSYEDSLKWFYQFKEQPVTLTYIQKKNGKLRPLGIPNISDRIIQQMILNVLEPICEGKFTELSFAFRREVSAKDALHKLVRHNMTNPYSVSIDLENYFNEIPHWKIIQNCYDIGIRDKWVLKAIKTIIKSPVYKEDGSIEYPNKGVPQGGILSPLLGNIVLHEFDKWFESQWLNFEPKSKTARKDFQSKVNCYKLKVPTGNTYIKKYTSIWRGKKVYKKTMNNHHRKIRLKQGYMVRYADDIIILCKSLKTAKLWKYSCVEKLQRMGLKVNTEKTAINDNRLHNLRFLGYEVKLRNGTQRWKNRKIYHPIIMMEKSNKKRYTEESRRLLRKLYCNQIDSYTYNSFITGVCNYYDYITYYWNTTSSLQNGVEKLYRKLNNRNGWRFSYIPKKYIRYKIHGVSLERYRARKVLWRVIKGTLEVIHIWEYKKKEPYMYERPSFPKDRLLWDKSSDHVFELIFKTDWYKREKYMTRKNLACEIYFPSLFSQQRGKCRKCKNDLYGLNTEVNHIVREDLGGTNDYNNLELLCSECHLEETITQLRTGQNSTDLK